MTDDPALALKVGRHLAAGLLAPLVETFGPNTLRSAFRSPAVNGYGYAHDLDCALNDKNFAAHICDRPA